MGSGFKRFMLAAAAVACLDAHAIATDWTVVDLTPEGMGVASAVSQNGIVVGCRDVAGKSRGFVYSNGQRRDLDAPASATSCGHAVNNNGVIGGAIDGEITVWDASGTRRLGVKGYVTGINEAGTVVGALTDAGGPSRAFMWSNGTFTDLGIDGKAIGINSRNQVAVFGAGKLYIYENGTLRDLGTPSVTTAAAVNESGVIVGGTSFGHGPAPYIYDGTVRDMAGGYSWSYAVGLNNAGQFLGSGEGVYGWLFDAAQNATVRLDALDKAATFLHHSEGKAINDRGWIVGQNGAPDFHAFLLIPKATDTAPASVANAAARATARSTPLIHAARLP